MAIRGRSHEGEISLSSFHFWDKIEFLTIKLKILFFSSNVRDGFHNAECIAMNSLFYLLMVHNRLQKGES